MLSVTPTEAPQIATEETLKHLEAVLASPAFAPSKRCQQFLRYVVAETVEGRGHLIKERNIAHEVFGKGLSFEPNEDALVRVKAREVRKRLVEYYQSAPNNGIRIDLPLGGYMPRIGSSVEPEISHAAYESGAPAVAGHLSRRRFAWTLGGTLAALGAASVVPLIRRDKSSLDLLWQPVFATKSPLLIFIPVLYDTDGQLTVKIGIGPAAALRRAADFLTTHRYPYHLRFGTDLTFPQMIEHPSLLLGGFASIWAMRIARDLPFTLTWDEQKNKIILDKRTGQVWRPVNPNPEGYADQDHGILCRVFDAESGQIVMIAAGITTFGTAGAADLLFDPDWFSELAKLAPEGWQTRNFEAVVRVSIIGMATSPPQIVATHFW
jgi:hypothetical protein